MSSNRWTLSGTKPVDDGAALPGDGQLITGQNIVCVSVMDWDWPFWTSRQNLMIQFARRNRVIFVDPPPTFSSDYYGAFRDPRLRKKITSWMVNGGFSARSANLTVWTPPPSIPFNRIKNRALFDRLLAFNQHVFRTHLRRALARTGSFNHILWISFNVYFGDAVAGMLGEALSVYHCTDEITGFPGYSPYINEIEKRLAARCDLVLSVSEVLRESKAAYNPNSYYIPNAADVELFSRALNWSGPEPVDLLRLPAPRAGFIGNVEYRFDCGLLRSVAEAMPAWSFALIGPVQEPNKEVQKLRDVPNVHFLGLKERASLPGYMAHLDVALIPYKINRLTRGIYPLKLHEYLAAGIPVVATPIPALSETAGMVYMGDDAPSFARAIARAYVENSPDARKRRNAAALSHSWAKRAEEISSLLISSLEARRGEQAGFGVPPDKSGSRAQRLAGFGVSPILSSPSTREVQGGSRAQRLAGFGVSPNLTSSTPGSTMDSPDAPMSEQPESKPIQTKADSYKFRLPLRFFLRSGSELTLRHGLIVKQAAYRLFGDLNLHRRVRASYVVAALLDLKVDTGEILDAGCGEGACSLAIARGIKGCRVLGVDTDEDSISTCSKIAQLLSLQNISFERVDVRDLPFRDRFDAAVCVDMLEHVEQDVAALQNLYRALKPGGRLIVHVPMQHQLQRRILPGFKSVRVIGHVRDEYSRDEIVQKVTRAGFQVDIVRSTFGIWGELAFELNTLFSEIPGLKVAAAAMTFPFALALAYRELSSSGRKGGNSIMVIARKPAPQTDLQNSSATPVPGSGGRLTP